MYASLQKICNQEYCKNEAKNEIQRNSQKTSLGKSFPPSRKPTKSYWNISGLQVLICTLFLTSSTSCPPTKRIRASIKIASACLWIRFLSFAGEITLTPPPLPTFHEIHESDWAAAGKEIEAKEVFKQLPEWIAGRSVCPCAPVAPE